MRNAWLIYNPAAGRFPAGWLLSRAVKVLNEAGWELEVQETDKGRDLSGLARQAVKHGCQAVFVAGGDGSVGRVASALAGTDVALGVLPSGTANVWAREIGLDRLDWVHLFALEKAAGRLARGEIRQVDLGRANEQEFLLWAGIGLDAQIVSSLEPRGRLEKSFGTVHYGLLGLWNSLGWNGVDLRVSSGDQVWEDRFLVAIASNIRKYAGGLLELTPDARFDDGKLDFWLISGSNLRDAVVRAVQVLLGVHFDAPGVVHFQSSKAVFEADGEITMHFDGEPLVVDSPLKFSTLSRSLNVLMPEPAAEAHRP
jgi:YegS/Rv2252/BmrU family lipid kinase